MGFGHWGLLSLLLAGGVVAFAVVDSADRFTSTTSPCTIWDWHDWRQVDVPEGCQGWDATPNTKQQAVVFLVLNSTALLAGCGLCLAGLGRPRPSWAGVGMLLVLVASWPGVYADLAFSSTDLVAHSFIEPFRLGLLVVPALIAAARHDRADAPPWRWDDRPARLLAGALVVAACGVLALRGLSSWAWGESGNPVHGFDVRDWLALSGPAWALAAAFWPVAAESRPS